MKTLNLKNADGKPVNIAVYPLRLGTLQPYRVAVKSGDIEGQVRLVTGGDPVVEQLSVSSVVEVLRVTDEMNAIALAELEQFEAKRTNTPKG